MYAKFCCAPMHIKKALGIFRELITTTRVAVRYPPSGSKNGSIKCVYLQNIHVQIISVILVLLVYLREITAT